MFGNTRSTRTRPRRYSVVAAAYDVETYLESFLRSLIRQSLGFERHIELILVDDGSRDRSAQIIARWARRYPRSIRLLRQQNGGQASARNLGLDHATGDWITFIDPDDFVDRRYFERVDDLLSRHDARDVVLVGCRMVFCERGRTLDTHPLRGQFAAGDTITRVGPSSRPIQLSAASAFFRGDLLRARGRRFDEHLRPGFEDGHFVGRYLVDHPGALALCAGAKYFCRKRDHGSPTDRGWSHPGRFGVVLERGYLDLLRASAQASNDGRPAAWAQRTVLCELSWYLDVLVGNDEALAFLSNDQRARFRELFNECFAWIDAETILEFELAGASRERQVGILGRFKNSRPPTPYVLADSYDDVKRCLRLRFFQSGPPPPTEISLDGSTVAARVAKTRRVDLFGEPFVHEHIMWIDAPRADQTVTVRIGGADAQLELPGGAVARTLTVRNIAAVLDRKAHSPRLPVSLRAESWLARTRLLRSAYVGAFLFMDRDSQADDNAEHLYRYVLRTRPDLPAFFILRRNSHDWPRLEREGFRLIPYGSLRHRLALLHARHLVSSQADNYVLAYPTMRHRRELQRSRFTFLQHGVIKHDLSRWLNAKNIDCFVTASPAEYRSIVESGSPYRFTEREVVLTGLPRHDALTGPLPPPERVLLVMPTWRQSLAGAQQGKSAVRSANPAFYTSAFAATWRSFLHSPRLRALVADHRYRVVFFPHANLEPYLEWFAPPDFVETRSHRDGRSIQNAFLAASVMLTDYSSTAFDMAYLRRPVLYYQFDRALVFGGGHTTKPGYFDYERDGFGPVCANEDSLMIELARAMTSGATPAPQYHARMERAFAFRDGQSCRRTLDAILDLDRPLI